MNLLLRVSLTAASHKTFRHKAALLSNVNTMIRSFATTAGNSESEEQAAEKKKMMNPSGDDFVTYNNTKVESELSRADWTRRRLKRLSPNKVTYMCLINSLCKHDFIEEAYWVLKKMIDSGFSPSLVTLNDVLRCFIRIGDMRNALEMRNEMRKNINFYGMDNATESSLYQGLLNEVTYTSLVTAYLDEGKWDNARALYYELEYLDQLLDDKPHCSHLCLLPESVLDKVFINELDNKARTTQIKKELLEFNYVWYNRPIFEYHCTLAENISQDEFKRVVALVEGFCTKGLENVDTLLNPSYKPDGIDDGIVYNLCIIAHCSRNNVDQAYNIYKEMVCSGFACHMITLFALITTLENARIMVNELRWVIQNVLRTCNLNDSEIDKFLNEFEPRYLVREALLDLLAEKAKDGLFLKCSYAPASATAAGNSESEEQAAEKKMVNPSGDFTMIRIFPTAAGNPESEEQAAEKKMMNPSGDFVTYNTKVEELSRADRKLDYSSNIDSLCKQDRIDEAYRVLNQMIVSGFSPLFVILNDVLRGFLRIGETRKDFEMRNEINEHIDDYWIDNDTESLYYQGLSDAAAYTSLMNDYLDEGNWKNAFKLYSEMDRLETTSRSLSNSVLDSVIINGVDKKSRTTKTKMYLLRFNYNMSLERPILEYHSTLAENTSEDEFKRVVELVEGLCILGLENVFDTLLKPNHKLDGIVYNLFIIGHCKHNNVHDAYNMYKDMGHYGFSCHMFIVFALIKTLHMKHMVNELLWVIQNVSRSCNLNDSEIVKFLNEFNPEESGSEALFDVLAEKAKDGLFLKCSYAPASA